MNHTICSPFPVFIDMWNFSKHSAQNSILSLAFVTIKKGKQNMYVSLFLQLIIKMYLQRRNQL